MPRFTNGDVNSRRAECKSRSDHACKSPWLTCAASITFMAAPGVATTFDSWVLRLTDTGLSTRLQSAWPTRAISKPAWLAIMFMALRMKFAFPLGWSSLKDNEIHGSIGP